MSFQVRGIKENPYHLSIGAVVFDGNKYALLKKSNGYYTLPKETTYSNESIEDTFMRGMEEELGIKMEAIKFIGSLSTKFNRPDNILINKTTIYFLCKKIGDSQLNPKVDEINDEILWLKSDNIEKYLDECSNPEVSIFRYAVMFP